MRPALTFLLLLSATPLRAAEDALPALEAGQVEVYVGRPADPARAHAVLAAARRADVDTLVEVVSTVGRCGGRGAADALLRLVRHDVVRVRSAVLRAIGRVGLRRDAYARAVRSVALWAYEEDLIAAIRILGRVGDGSDIPALLSRLEEGDNARSAAAHAALRDVTGKKLPRNAKRWSSWWRTVGSPRARSLRKAAIVNGERPVLLSKAALLDLPKLCSVLGRWLRSDNDALSLLACDVALEHGLLAVTSDLQTAAGFRARSPRVRAAAARVLAAFGVERSATQPDPAPPEAAPAPEDPATAPSPSPAQPASPQPAVKKRSK